MTFEIAGKLIEKYPIIQRTETFKTREFVIQTNEVVSGRNYANYIKFQLIQDRTALIENIPLESEVKVMFNLKGTKWSKNGTDNYITNLDAWRISVNSSSNEPVDNDNNFTDISTPDVVDDLPF